MPRYDYECDTCHHKFELRQSFDSEPVAECPECQNSARRKFHAVPVVFKGSGWYVNDYGKRGSASTSGTDSSKRNGESESKSSSGSSDAKSESSTNSTPKSESTSKSSTSKESSTTS